MSRSGGDEEDEEVSVFYESLERIPSSESSSAVNSEFDQEEEEEADADDSSPEGSSSDRFLTAPKFPMGVSSYKMWTSEPVSSVKERRFRLLKQMGLSSDQVLSRVKCGGSVGNFNSFRSCSEGEASCSSLNDFCYVNSFGHVDNGCDILSGDMSSRALLNKPPTGRNRHFESVMMTDVVSDAIGMEKGRLRVKNIDHGKEFVVNGVREDGSCNKLKEVSTGKHRTIEELDICAGHTPIVQELMRRETVEGGNKDEMEAVGNGLKQKKRGSWLNNLRIVTRTIVGQKERRSSEERDNVSDRGRRRSSSATDDGQDIVGHGPKRVRVRQNGKSSKELSALYKSQEISAHSGSIWSVEFSLDGKYLASAGEDCVIHVWQVVGSERKGDLLTDDVNSNILFWANGSPGASSSVLKNPLEKKRRDRSSFTRKSFCMENIYVPETVFSISDKPFCSFHGHADGVLDLSWSKSQESTGMCLMYLTDYRVINFQYLLSSSMDKTVRLWHLSSQSCLKIFSHNDYVTCINFNPADDRYFLSGSLDAKVRIWSIPDHQVVDWTDLHEMVTAACYTPDGQGAWVGSYKGSCRHYITTENKLVQNREINLQNMNKKSHQKKITGFQFTPGSLSEVLVTSADSRIRVIHGDELVHKFKGFRNTQTQIAASITRNGRYIIAASEDSNVYMWRHDVDSRPRGSKTVNVTHAYENFHCQDVSVAISWSGSDRHEDSAENDKERSTDNFPTINDPSTSSGESTSKIFGMTGYSLQDETRVSTSSISSSLSGKSAWGMVIVTGGLRGELKIFQNFGLPSIRN